jgi:hypothetical protein
VRSFVVRRDLERRAGPGGDLLEDQRDVPPRQPMLVVAEAEALLGPEIAGEVDKVCGLLGALRSVAASRLRSCRSMASSGINAIT